MIGQRALLFPKGFRKIPDKRRGITTAMLAGIVQFRSLIIKMLMRAAFLLFSPSSFLLTKICVKIFMVNLELVNIKVLCGSLIRKTIKQHLLFNLVKGGTV